MHTPSHNKYDIGTGIYDDEHLRAPFLAEYSYKEYSYHHTDPTRLTAYYSHVLRGFLCASHEKKQAIIAKEDENIVGVLTWEFLEWDTAHFGFPCHRIAHLLVEKRSYVERVEIARQLLLYVLNIGKRKGIRFLSAKIPGEDVAIIHAFESCGFRSMGTEMVLRWPPDVKLSTPPFTYPLLQPHFCVRLFSHRTPDGLSSLYNIQTHDRFHRDPGFPQDACDAFWNNSLKNSCAGYADQIVMAFEQQQPAAVVSIFLNSQTLPFLDKPVASLFLVGVSSSHQGQGLGTWVVQHAISWSVAQADYIEVETQSDNYGALALYQKVGFHICFSKVILHTWL